MKRTLLALGTIFIGATASAQDCSDLFISEYAEGWSNNKALEIYNPTNATIDLSQYFVARYSNGSTGNTSGQTLSIGVQLVGMLAPHDVHVGVIDQRDPNGTGQDAPIWDSLEVRADAFYCPVYEDTYAFYFNGNDALVLYKGTTANIANAQIVDIFGKIGEDPGPGTGWSTAFPYNNGLGTVVSVDHSMIRKPAIKKGEVNPTISFFDPMLEYDTIPAVVDIGGTLYGNWFSLGEHDCECNPLGLETTNATPEVVVAPNPTKGVFTVNNIAEYNSIEVVNSLGQSVMVVTNNNESSRTFDFSDRRGVYFVRLTSQEGKTITRRVIVR